MRTGSDPEVNERIFISVTRVGPTEHLLRDILCDELLLYEYLEYGPLEEFGDIDGRDQ